MKFIVTGFNQNSKPKIFLTSLSPWFALRISTIGWSMPTLIQKHGIVQVWQPPILSLIMKKYGKNWDSTTTISWFRTRTASYILLLKYFIPQKKQGNGNSIQSSISIETSKCSRSYVLPNFQSFTSTIYKLCTFVWLISKNTDWRVNCL